MNDLSLFALNRSRAFGERVSRHLAIGLSGHEEREFEDGEHKARPLAGVRGKDVFVMQSLYRDEVQSGNDKLCRLLFSIGALKDAAAGRVTAVVPYLAYSRSDKKSEPRDPVTTRYVAALFDAVGTDAVVTLDVHNLAAYQNAFRCHTEHLEAAKLLAAHFASLPHDHEIVVVSPDAGGIGRAERFRQRLAAVLGKQVGAAFAEKHRSGDVVRGRLMAGDVKGKDAIIVDDMISTGTTLARVANACHAAGANSVSAAATHGLFAGAASAVLADSALERIAVTDTVPLRLDEGDLKAKVTVVDSTALFAEAIRRMHEGGSVTALMEA
jgi:ribose-phosphate pyrophosphokinase